MSRKDQRWFASAVLGALSLTFFFGSFANASNELDRMYSLERVGVLRSWDNVDGVFQDYLSRAYQAYFSKNSRFAMQDLSKADEILSKSKLAYSKLIEDPEILGQLARAARAETLLRTRVYKETGRYRFFVEWIHSPTMEILASETGYLEETQNRRLHLNDADMKVFTKKLLDQLISKVPFLGQITGRDQKMITVNMGAQSGLNEGDALYIATLREVKKHPLLKSIEAWETQPTGVAEVQEIDEGIAFANIIEESKSNPVAKYQKIVRVERKKRPEEPKPHEASVMGGQEEEGEGASRKPVRYENQPKIGWAAIGPWLGSMSREFTQSGGGGRKGGGFTLGGRAEGQLWLTREFFANVLLGYGIWNHSQTDSVTGASASSAMTTGNLTLFKIGGGYSYFVNPNDLFGPKGWIKANYQRQSYNMPINTSEYLATVTLNALALGLGGDLPIRDGWGLMTNIDFGLLTGANANDLGQGAVSGTTQIAFQFGIYDRIQPNLTLKLGIDVWGDSVEFANGSTVSHRVIAFSPSVVFYF